MPNLDKILSKEDISSIGINVTAALLAGKFANVISNSVFHYDLNHFNFIDHLWIGVGLGTYSYKKAGGGIKGLAAGLIAGTMFSAAWEPVENLYIFKADKILNPDTIHDIAVVYAGNILGFLGEKAKKYLNKKNKK